MSPAPKKYQNLFDKKNSDLKVNVHHVVRLTDSKN